MLSKDFKDQTIYTIGHSNHETVQFVELLKAHDINVVVDVRSVPYSQYTPQFNREHIKAVLKENGIAYIFMGEEFGARRDDRTLYDEDGKLDFARTIKSDLFQSGIERIRKGMEKNYRIAFMCAEKIPHECHRCIMVGKAFHDLGCDVRNILEDGSTVSQEEIGKILLEMFFPNRNQIEIFTMDEQKSDNEYIEEAYRLRGEQIASVYHSDTLDTGHRSDSRSKRMLDDHQIVIKTEGIIPEKVRFENYEEIKQYLKNGLAAYNNTRYSIDNVDQAWADFDVLKSVRKRLTGKKKELEAAYTAPIREAVDQLDELINMVKEPYVVIDKMLKNNAKAIKELEIRRYAYNKAVVLDEYALSIIESPSFFNPKWKNASYSENKWKADIDNIIGRAARDIEIIEREAGENKAAIMAYYVDRLSLDGIHAFIRNLEKADPSHEPIEPTQNATDVDNPDDSNAVDHIGAETIYKDDRDNSAAEPGLAEIYNKQTLLPGQKEEQCLYNLIISGSNENIQDFLGAAKNYNITVIYADKSDMQKDAMASSILNQSSVSNRHSFGSSYNQHNYSGSYKKKQKKPGFYMTSEEKERFRISNRSVYISEIARALNNAVGDNRAKISYRTILLWLKENGYIIEEKAGENILRKPTDKGKKAGIILEKRESPAKGTYYLTLYSPEVQKEILENINEIASLAKK